MKQPASAASYKPVDVSMFIRDVQNRSDPRPRFFISYGAMSSLVEFLPEREVLQYQ